VKRPPSTTSPFDLLHCTQFALLQKQQLQLPIAAHNERAKFLDATAQIIILSVIFQAIAAKFRNRALLRHVVQNLRNDPS
jgi:hypothetical protein